MHNWKSSSPWVVVPSSSDRSGVDAGVVEFVVVGVVTAEDVSGLVSLEICPSDTGLSLDKDDPLGVSLAIALVIASPTMADAFWIVTGPPVALTFPASSSVSFTPEGLAAPLTGVELPLLGVSAPYLETEGISVVFCILFSGLTDLTFGSGGFTLLIIVFKNPLFSFFGAVLGLSEPLTVFSFKNKIRN